MNTETEYEVTIFYREPSYELRNGRKKDPYTGDYRVRTDTKEKAKELALKQFEEQGDAALVSWIRVVESIRVRKVRKTRVV